MEKLSAEKQQWLHTIETFVIIALVSYALYGGYIIAQASEEVISNECQTINTVNNSKSGYGSPFNLFSDSRELLMKVECKSGKTATVYLGNGKSNLYIYKYGYNKVGGAWEKVRFTGEKTVGPWIVGNATGEIKGIGEGDLGKVLAYMCQKIDGRWKCGCENYSCSKPKWQLQAYSMEVSGDAKKEGEAYIKNKVEEDFTDQPFEFDNHPMTYYTSQTFVLPGEKVSVSGFGYGEGTLVDILWDDDVLRKNVAFYEGRNLYFTVPDVPSGKYRVTFEQDGVIASPDSVIWVKKSKDPTPPQITRLSKDTYTQGEKITIFGNGFDSKQNDVLTAFGVVTNVSSSDGKSITFTYDPFPNDRLEAYDEVTSEKVEFSIPVNVKVINANGESNPLTFDLEYD